MRKASGLVIARPRRGRSALSAKREEVPLGCNLGKALPIYTECRRTQSLSNLTVAALSERHGGLQYAPHCLYGARLSDLSLRGAKRRGNLAEPDRTTGKSSAKSQLPSRDCTPRALPRAQGATAPLGPRNDKLGGIAPNNLCRNYCQPVRRSGNAATDAIGAHHFNGGLYELQVPSRDCHVGLRPPRNDKPLVSTILTAAYTNCKYLPEIATSAYGLLAMTNLKASRRRIPAAYAASLHGAH